MTSKGNQNESYGFPQLGSNEPGEKPELSAHILFPFTVYASLGLYPLIELGIVLCY